MGTISADALQRARLNELPSPPQLLLPLMRLCADDEAAPADASKLISRDSALSTRMLSAVSAPVFARHHAVTTLDSAVRALGMDTVRSLALAATVQQFFSSVAGHNRDWLPLIWEQALCCATLGYQIARHTACARPDEAYLAGLLHNIGQLALSHQLRQDYTAVLDEAHAGERHLAHLERERFGIDHVQLGADLLERWQVPALLVDAVRYHQEDADRLADAHGLVRSTALARALAASRGEPDSVARQAAARLFDLGPTATICIFNRATDDQDRIRSALGDEPELPSAAQGRDGTLGQELRQATLLGDVRRHLQDDTPVDGIARCAMLLFGIRHLLCLQRDEDGAFMRVLPPTGTDPRLAELHVPADRERSLMAACLLDNHPAHTLDPAVGERLAIIDRQLQSQLPGDGLLCLPMRAGETPVGVLVLGIRHDQVSALLDESPLLLAFAREAGQALLRAGRRRRRQRQAVTEGVAAARVDRDDLIREASEPLTIMQNYLAALKEQIARGDPAHGQVLALNEEAQRLARLLAEHGDGDSDNAGVNEQIRRAIRVADNGGLLPVSVTLRLELNPGLDAEPVAAPPSLQQILLNLLRLLAGRLTAGVTLTLRTTGFVETAGQRYIEILLEHSGPGLPESLRRQLVAGSPPGDGGAGAEAEGLHVAVTLLRDAGGVIMHRQDNGEGSRLQILLPPHAADEEASEGLPGPRGGRGGSINQ